MFLQFYYRIHEQPGLSPNLALSPITMPCIFHSTYHLLIEDMIHLFVVYCLSPPSKT